MIALVFPKNKKAVTPFKKTSPLAGAVWHILPTPSFATSWRPTAATAVLRIPCLGHFVTIAFDNEALLARARRFENGRPF